MKVATVPQCLIEVRPTTSVRDVDGGQHHFLVGVRVQIETNVDVVGERNKRHLEAVRRLVGANRQRVNDGADELNNALEVFFLDAARRVQREHDVSRGVITPCNNTR